MLRWIVLLSAMCGLSGAGAFGFVVPISHDMQSALFTLTALTGALLVSSFDAFETQSASVEADEEG